MTTNTELSDEPLYADSFGYSLAMRVMQSDLYHSLDAQERAECDELIRRGQALSAVSRSEVGEPAPVGEPVAWMRKGTKSHHGVLHNIYLTETLGPNWIPLYASPLPQEGKALTDVIEEIAQQWDGCIYENSIGGDIPIGDAIRAAGGRLLRERELRGPQEGEEAARYRWLTESPTPWETRVAQLKAWSDAATLKESSEAQGEQQ